MSSPKQTTELFLKKHSNLSLKTYHCCHRFAFHLQQKSFHLLELLNCHKTFFGSFIFLQKIFCPINSEFALAQQRYKSSEVFISTGLKCLSPFLFLRGWMISNSFSQYLNKEWFTRNISATSPML